MSQWSGRFRIENPGKKIGLVPTMGYLHEGHLSLIKKIKDQCDVVVVSIFVNPIQFNNPEDLEKYPRDLARDMEMVKNAGGDLVFCPDANNVYPNGKPEIFIDYPKLTNKLCGKFRPGHFSGVLTIVHNLFQWVKPHVSIFGRKDFQQLLLIKNMNRDLHMNVKILEGEIVREKDSLAMSSRNVRLSEDQRKLALKIPEALFHIENFYKKEKSTSGILKQILLSDLAGFDVEYASLYNPETLEELADNEPAAGSLAAVAVNMGNIRLIDNLII
jgi:pantoate--beta-alanine ligase